MVVSLPRTPSPDAVTRGNLTAGQTRCLARLAVCKQRLHGALRLRACCGSSRAGAQTASIFTARARVATPPGERQETWYTTEVQDWLFFMQKPSVRLEQSGDKGGVTVFFWPTSAKVTAPC